MIIANCIVVLIQSYPELLGHEVVTNNVMIQGGWEVMEVIFTLLYVLEMIAKIVVLGWDRYSSSLRHVFDGLITVLCLSTIIVVYYPNECNNPVIIQVVLVLRIFRIVRLFMVMESFQVSLYVITLDLHCKSLPLNILTSTVALYTSHVSLSRTFP